MSKFSFQGLIYRLKEGTPADVDYLIKSAMKDVKRMEMWHDPSVKIQRWSKPGMYDIKKFFGQVFIDLSYGREVSEYERVRKWTLESISEYPVPVWELLSGGTILGWGIPLSTAWVEPAFYRENKGDNTVPRMYIPLQPDKDTIQIIEIYPLDYIGTKDTADYSGDWDSTDEDFWGEDEDYVSPEHAVLGIEVPSDEWLLTVHGVTYVYVKDTNTDQQYKLWVNASCMRVPSIAIVQDYITKSYFTSFYIEDEGHTVQFPSGSMMYWVNYKDGFIADDMKIGDTVIYDYYMEDYSEFRQWGSFGGECDSYASMFENSEGDTYMWDEHESVRGVDKYADDKTGIALWGHQVIKWPDNFTRGPISPWCSEPYAGTFYDDEDCFVYWYGIGRAPEYTQQLKVKAFCPDYDVEEYVGEEEYGNYNTWPDPMPLDSNSAFDVGIYDFHGKPFFMFSWYDYRGPYMQYGLVWKEKVSFSERFDADGNYYHPLYANDVGPARGFFTACGVRITTFKETTENG